MARLESERQAGVRRYQATCVAAILGASIPYLWVAWDDWTGRINPLRLDIVETYRMYDLQARAIMHGHLWLPPGSIWVEAFLSHGRQYTYFGIFPSLLRIPIFLFTSSLDGRLFSLSITAAWVVTAVFCSLLLWRLRVFLRGDAPLGWLEAASYGVFLVAILLGSVLVYLASRPDAFNEDEAWSVALLCGALFALVGVLERPSWRRIGLCGSLVLLTNLNRAPTGYAAILATALVSLWFALGRQGQAQRRWAFPLAGAAFISLAIGCAINIAKFGVLFGVPFSSQLLFHAYGLQRINGGRYFSLHWLPSTLRAYVDPVNIRFSSVFPYVVLPDEPSGMFGTDPSSSPTAGIPLSVPLLFLSGLWGVTTTFTPGRSKPFRALRLLLIASAMPAAALMVYGWVFERFVSDFLPLLLFAGMIGLVDVWGRLSSQPRTTRTFVPAVVGALALLSIWANVGFSIAPYMTWTSTQSANYVKVQRAFSDVTGHPLDHKVVVESQFPGPEPVGTLFVQGHCKALFLSFATVPNHLAALFFYVAVERAPHTPICDSLIERRPDLTTKR